MVLAARGDWLDSVPGPIVLLLMLVVAGAIAWFAISRTGDQMDRELREAPDATTGRMLAALPAPVTRTLFLVVAAGLVAYGVIRVV